MAHLWTHSFPRNIWKALFTFFPHGPQQQPRMIKSPIADHDIMASQPEEIAKLPAHSPLKPSPHRNDNNALANLARKPGGEREGLWSVTK